MNQFDANQLEQLLKAGDLDKAKEVLGDFLATNDMTQEEKGAAYVALAELYLEFNNQLNEEYSAFLKESLESLKAISVLENKIQETQDLTEVRKKLQ